MNRRDFLTFGVKVAVAAAMPKAALAFTKESESYFGNIHEDYIDGFPDFNPDYSYGNVILLNKSFEDLDANQQYSFINILEKDMWAHIPPSHRHRVTYPKFGLGLHGITDAFDEVATIAWKYK